MSLFNITWRTQVSNLLPWFKRITNVIDYITALLEPLKTKATEWHAFDDDMRKRAKFNGQAVVLAAALNNIFGVTTAPYILIQTVNNVGLTTFIYNDDEEITYIYKGTEGMGTTYFYNESEIILDYDFIVSIPSGIYTTELDRQITSEVKKYKLAGKKFITDTY